MDSVDSVHYSITTMSNKIAYDEMRVNPIRTVYGRNCDLVDIAFLMPRMGYTLEALKMSNLCQAANNDAQLVTELEMVTKLGNYKMMLLNGVID